MLKELARYPGSDLRRRTPQWDRTNRHSGEMFDYRLKLYGTRDYLDRHPEVQQTSDLKNQAFIGYVADLAFSHELLYLERTVPNVTTKLCSASIIAQYYAALEGNALAILPCFMAEPNPSLMPVLPDEVAVTRHFWLCCREDLRKLRRIRSLWDYLRAAANENRSLFLGESAVMRYVDPSEAVGSENAIG